MGKEWNVMTKEELEEYLLSGALDASGPYGERALERLRILWRQEDSQMAEFAKRISIWAIVIAGLTFLATVGWWVWTFYVWTRGECV